MPDLDTELHKTMLGDQRRKYSLLHRVRRAIRAAVSEMRGAPVYGVGWGDPETHKALRHVKDTFLVPYVRPDAVVVEIGPGGGRWSRYMLGARRLYLVEYYPELLDVLRVNIAGPNVVYVKNNGTDFPGIEDHTVDFLYTFGTFVHLDRPLIEGYLGNMKRILKPDAVAVVQYSDKTKPMAKANAGFSENEPATMRKMVTDAGFTIVEEDTGTLPHSSIVRFRP